MLGGVSLTCARGVDADEFLLALGADPEELAGRTPCEDLVVPARRRGGRSPHMNRAMYGTCGDWVYVLEGWGMATWATGYRAVESMRPAPDEEIVCVTMNAWHPPPRIIHAPGDGRVRQAEFGEDTGGLGPGRGAPRGRRGVFRPSGRWTKPPWWRTTRSTGPACPWRCSQPSAPTAVCPSVRKPSRPVICLRGPAAHGLTAADDGGRGGGRAG